MKRWLGIVFFVCAWMSAHAEVEEEQRDSLPMPYVYAWRYVRIETHEAFPAHDFRFRVRRTDRGIFGGQLINGMRLYGDITMPTITSECLVDVGRALSQMGGLLGQCPRWFTMFDPGACPTDELFGSAKANTAIMVTMRTYF